jgi:pimeloyl-ACP methyl ester carboxylesterase
MLIEANGVRLFALEAGTGAPTLVFVHGNGADHTAWHLQIAHFSPITRVVAVDQRGFGQSSRDPEGIYSQDRFVGDLQATLEALNVQRAILIGWSMGGSVVARCAVEHPERVAGVVLVDHNLGAAQAELGIDQSRTRETVALLRDDFEGQGYRKFVDNWFPESGPEIELLRQWMYSSTLRAGREVVYGIRSIGVGDNRRGWFDRLSVPTLVLQGGASYLGGRAVGEHLARMIPNAELCVLEGRGHCLFLTAPDEFNAALERFFHRVATGAAS